MIFLSFAVAALLGSDGALAFSALPPPIVRARATRAVSGGAQECKVETLGDGSGGPYRLLHDSDHTGSSRGRALQASSEPLSELARTSPPEMANGLVSIPADSELARAPPSELANGLVSIPVDSPLPGSANVATGMTPDLAATPVDSSLSESANALLATATQSGTLSDSAGTVSEAAAESLPETASVLSDATTTLMESAAKSLGTEPTSLEPAARSSAEAAVETLSESAAQSGLGDAVAPPAVDTPLSESAKSLSATAKHYLGTLSDSAGTMSEAAAKSLSETASTLSHTTDTLFESAAKSLETATSVLHSAGTKSGAAVKSISETASAITDNTNALLESAGKSLGTAKSALDSAGTKSGAAVKSLSETASALSDTTNTLFESTAQSLERATTALDSAAKSLGQPATKTLSESAAKTASESPAGDVAPTLFEYSKEYIRENGPPLLSYIKEKGPPLLESARDYSAAMFSDAGARYASVDSPPLRVVDFPGASRLPHLEQAAVGRALGEMSLDVADVFRTGGDFINLMEALRMEELGGWYAGTVLVAAGISNGMVEASYRRERLRLERKEDRAARLAVLNIEALTTSAKPLDRQVDDLRDAVRLLAEEVKEIQAEKKALEREYAKLAREMEANKEELEKRSEVERNLRAELMGAKLVRGLETKKDELGQQLAVQAQNVKAELMKERRGDKDSGRIGMAGSSKSQAGRFFSKLGSGLKPGKNEPEQNTRVKRNRKAEQKARGSGAIRLVDATFMDQPQTKVAAEVVRDERAAVEAKRPDEKRTAPSVEWYEAEKATADAPEQTRVAEGERKAKDLRTAKEAGTAEEKKRRVEAESPEKGTAIAEAIGKIAKATEKESAIVPEGMSEPRAASFLVDDDDPTRLTWKELEDGWGSWTNFMVSYGLNPANGDDLEEALAISRNTKKYLKFQVK